MSFGRYPATRLRRTRRAPFIRDLVRETHLSPAQLIAPLFIAEAEQAGDVPSMPGVLRLTIDGLISECEALRQLGIGVVALFPALAPELKDDQGTQALNADGLVPRAIRAVKQACPDLGVMVDIALDPYTSHGHDGVLDADGYVDNDRTVEIFTRQAKLYARSGADILSPSDMMDGRIGRIRETLERDNHKNVLLLSYAAKYASGFYGPFRDAVGSKTQLGKRDKRSYQMDPANSDEAIREVALDLDEGADLVMVKPGLPYLDIIRRVKDRFGVPTVAYQVSGEYAMLKAAAQNGWIDERTCVMESLLCLRRAGADAILSYYAKQVAQWLHEEGV